MGQITDVLVEVTTVRADVFTDEAGSGSPSFPNGLSSDESFGIGTSNPTFGNGGGLHINNPGGANRATIRFTDDTTSSEIFHENALFINNLSANDIVFRTGGITERARITNGGEFRISGGVNPLRLSSSSNNNIQSTNTNLNFEGVGTANLFFGTNGTTRMTIEQTGGVLIDRGLRVGNNTSASWTPTAVVQAGQVSIYGDANQSHLTHNAYYDGSVWKSAANVDHNQIKFENDGSIKFRHADNLATDSTITWSDKVKVKPSGGIDLAHGGAFTSNMTSSVNLSNGQTMGWKMTSANHNSTDLGFFKNTSFSNAASYLGLSDVNNNLNYFWADSSARLRTSTSASLIGSTSGTVVGDQTSDARLKENIIPIRKGLETVLKLNPVEFNFLYSKDKNQLGFLAQEVEPFVPEAPYRTGGVTMGVENTYAMDYEQLIPILTKAIQELEEKVSKLELQLAS